MKLAVVYPAPQAGLGWCQLYEGTSRQLERRERVELHGVLAEQLAEIKPLLDQADRTIVLLDDMRTYWFALQIPFAQPKKIRAILPNLLAEQWPGDIDEVRWLYDRPSAAEEGGYRLHVCGMDRGFLEQISQTFLDAGCGYDRILPVSALISVQDPGMPVLLWQQSGLSAHLPWMADQAWHFLPSVRDGLEDGSREDQQRIALRWLQTVSRGSSERGEALQTLASGRLLQAGLGVPLPTGHPLPPVEVVRGNEDDFDCSLLDRAAIAGFTVSPYDFSVGMFGRKVRTNIVTGVSRGQLIMTGVALLIMLVSSGMSLHFKQTMESEIRQNYRNIFLRAFPNAKLGGDLVKKGKEFLATGTDVEEEPGVPVVEILQQLGKALPVGEGVQIRSAKLAADSWTLAGLCNDFACVDGFRTELGKLKGIKDVKLQNAKQTVDQQSVKFSLVVELGSIQ